MRRPGKKFFSGVCFIVAIISLLVFFNYYHVSLPVLSVTDIFKQMIEDELQVGKSCTIMDEDNRIITKVSRHVYKGDEIITAEGRRYRVQQVEGDTASAHFIEIDNKLLAYNDFYAKLEAPATAVVRNDRSIGIYHTHSDESYLPSDGKDSIPFKGGILQVGDSYSSSLTRDGAQVHHNKTPHDPHDNNAYYRSRRTAAQLMKSNPTALFDIHRDGIEDPDFYRRNISNEDVAQMRLVIGRENPHMSANLDFARRMMAYANKMHWPIAKEIYIGKGNYNQDLMPTALLIEAGTYTNTKEEAMRGISLLADAVPVVLGIAGPTGPSATAPVTGHKSSWIAVAWIVGITLLGGGIYLLVSAGGWNEAKNRLGYFFGREFKDVLGRARLKKK